MLRVGFRGFARLATAALCAPNEHPTLIFKIRNALRKLISYKVHLVTAKTVLTSVYAASCMGFIAKANFQI